MNYIIDINAHIFVPVYTINGHKAATLPRAQFKGRPGVYFIKENGTLVYVGCSRSDVYETAYRHFQQWNDPRGYERTTYADQLAFNIYTISVQATLPDDAMDVESAYITKYRPRDNKYKLDAIEVRQLVKEMNQQLTHVLVTETAPF